MKTSVKVIKRMIKRGIIPRENLKLASDELDKEIKRRSLLIARILAKMATRGLDAA